MIGTVDYTYKGKHLGTGNIIYNVKDITKLNTNSEVNKTKDNKPLDKKGSAINKIAFIVAICIVGIGCIYYVFIVNKRKKKRSYYRERRNSYYD